MMVSIGIVRSSECGRIIWQFASPEFDWRQTPHAETKYCAMADAWDKVLRTEQKPLGRSRLPLWKLNGASSVCLIQTAAETKERDVDLPSRQAVVAALARGRRREPARKLRRAARYRKY